MTPDRERIEREARELVDNWYLCDTRDRVGVVVALVLRERAAAWEKAARAIEKSYRTETQAERDGDEVYNTEGVRTRMRERHADILRALAAKERNQ